MKQHSYRTKSITFWTQTRIVLPALFLFTLSFHAILHYNLFYQNKPVFNKYPAFAAQYAHSTVDHDRLADFSPLYLSVHVFAQKHCSDPLGAIVWLQFALVAGSTVLLFLLLRLFFPAWIAIVGTVAFTINRSIVVYTSVFEPEVLLIFLVLGFLLSLVQRSRFGAGVAGICLGLILLIRLNLFPVALFVPLYFFLNGERNKILVRRTILFIVPVFLALLFLAIRNYSVSGTFSPVTMNPGFVFYEGNNPNANGYHVVYPPMVESISVEIPHEVDRGHISYRLMARRIAGQKLSVSEINSYWAGKAFNFIVDHPVHWCALAFRKTVAVFNAVRFHDISQVSANDSSLQKTMIPTIPFGFIAAMALAGLILSLRFWRERLPFIAVFLCQISVMVMTYASDRQRISIIGLFIFFAAAMAHDLIGKTLSIKLKIFSVGAILFFFVLFSMKSDCSIEDIYQRGRVRQAHRLMLEAQQDRNHGSLVQASGKNALAKAFLPHLTSMRLFGLWFNEGTLAQQALVVADTMNQKKAGFSFRFDLAVLCYENDSLAKAESIFTELIQQRHTFCRTSAQSSQPNFHLAKIYERHSLRSKAISSLHKALKNNPGDPWALSWLSALTGDNRFEKLIVRYFDDIDAAYFMGQAFFETGQIDGAIQCFDYLVEKNPEYADGVIYLSVLHGAKGDYERAARFFIQALEKKGEPLFAEKEIVNIFREWEKLNQQSPEAKYYAGVVLKAFGQYDEALSLFQEIVNANPAMEKVKDEIVWIERAKVAYGMK